MTAGLRSYPGFWHSEGVSANNETVGGHTDEAMEVTSRCP